MEIEIGDYIRTKTGFIGKVITKEGGYGMHYELNIKKQLQTNLIERLDT